ncbi:hypothetical protein M5C99_01715 [Acidovorax sp. NCPPB 2350]|nr:hypothetical protein M5C99_01715 [Acidovorax sp. NCPPB 2350]
MKTNIAAATAAALLASTTVAAAGPSVPQAIETRFEPVNPDMYPMDWIDDRHVLLTVPTGNPNQHWFRKTLIVDARTGEGSVFLQNAHLICTDPAQRIATLHEGSMERLFTGSGPVADPRDSFKSYRWDAAQQKPLAAVPGSSAWNPFICRATQAEDAQRPMAGFLGADIRYLENGDGFLKSAGRSDFGKHPSTWFHAHQKPKPVDVSIDRVAPTPQYLPYRDAHLLSAGKIAGDGTFFSNGTDRHTEYPLILLKRDGTLEKTFTQAALGHLKFSQAFVHPSAQGNLVYVASDQKEGGGIYLHAGSSLTRIWCTNRTSDPSRRCQIHAMKISPDGCRMAFVSAESDDPASTQWGKRLQFLPLCGQSR